MRESLEGIYQDHRQGLFTVALSITRDADRAEDAVHDAFAQLCRGAGTPTGDPVAYTYAAVRNAAIDILRKRSEVAVDFDDRGGASMFHWRSAPGSDAAAEVNEANTAVQSAIEELPDAQRQVLVMKAYAGLTFDQIAQACGEPLSTVASRYRRALETLKERLGSVV